jgi:hypothetical protein
MSMKTRFRMAVPWGLVLLAAAITEVYAQPTPAAASQAAGAGQAAADKSGTNPANFQPTLHFRTEYYSFADSGRVWLENAAD